jgi:hypothetical protein
MELHPGEVLEIGTPCGGGFGDPLEREPARVAADLRNGYVSGAVACDVYGVAVGPGGRVDAGATATLRERLRADRAPMRDFAAGPEREAFEARWTDALQSAVHAVVWTHPPGLRTILKRAVEASIRERFDAGERVDPDEVAGIADEALTLLQGRLYA